MENETKLTVKCFSSDNMGEYSSKVFVDFKMRRLVSKKPQQNGAATMINCALNEKVKSIKFHEDLTYMFWENPVNTTMYLINKEPSFHIGFKIREDKWQGREISLRHLKVFGCVSYAKVKDS